MNRNLRHAPARVDGSAATTQHFFLRVPLAVAAVALALTAIACSAKQQSAEQNIPQCLSLCSNQFAACTEEFPGDASACLPARRDCERTCEGEKAMQRAEDGRGVEAPVDPPTIVYPDAGTD